MVKEVLTKKEQEQIQAIIDVLDHPEKYNIKSESRAQQEIDSILAGLSYEERLKLLRKTADLEKAGLGFDIEIIDEYAAQYVVGTHKHTTADGGTQVQMGSQIDTSWIDYDKHISVHRSDDQLTHSGYVLETRGAPDGSYTNKSHNWGTEPDDNWDEVTDATGKTTRTYTDGHKITTTK